MNLTVLCLFALSMATGPSISPVKEVQSQAEAVREARNVDLPLLKTADTIVIDGRGKQTTVRRANEVTELRNALKASGPTPSGGKVGAKMTFYRGKDKVRTVWVYGNGNGEWGFERPGTKWTIGADEDLWLLVKKHLNE